MFVRLFVDENLDRHVPISKQPKEKIQAIIDSCTRQFPEYSERARKRIRTYLKSCRRTKRSREQAGLDTNNVSILGQSGGRGRGGEVGEVVDGPEIMTDVSVSGQTRQLFRWSLCDVIGQFYLITR